MALALKAEPFRTAATGHGDKGTQQFEIQHPIDPISRSIISQNIVSAINDGLLPLLSTTALNEVHHVRHCTTRIRSRLPSRAPLLRLCARYLTRQPSIRIDPVARFHLGNGARLERINWLGNSAPRGIQESFGIMVNYLYDHDSIENNHEAFVRDRTIVRSAEVDALLQTTSPRKRGEVSTS
jgi:Malonyl-CoA decarboxylase C-terminal domain